MASDPGEFATFYGRFSDGKTASARDADLKLTSRGIEIRVTGQTIPLVWPYDTLSSAEPLGPYAIDALLSSTVSPGASLFATEGTFARRLATKAPQLTPRAQRWRNARPWVLVTALVLAIGTAISVLNLSPSHFIATMLPDKARTKLGDQAIASMTGERRVCDDPKGVAALDKMMAKLSKASGSDAKFNVRIVDWGMLNAFAVPGERIITTRRLIAKAESSDEVAGVLAHEMGHGIGLHAETGLVRAIGLSAGVELMMGGSGGTLANMGVLLAALHYTRDAEREADDHALRILKNAKISPKGLESFFARLMSLDQVIEKSGAKTAFDMFSTHPGTAERVAKIKAQADYPSEPALTDADWADLKQICGPPGKDAKDDEDEDDDLFGGKPDATDKKPEPEKKAPAKPAEKKPARDI